MDSAFIAAVTPNFDSGIAAVPTSSADVPGTTPTTPYWLAGVSFANTNAAARTLRVTDGAGATIVPDVLVPGKSSVEIGPWNLRPVVGLKWFADGAGVNGQAWGWK